MSSLELFVLNHLFWAYAILFGGMFIEGEVFFLTAAIFAWQGYMSWPILILTAFAGVVLGDIAWYFLGRYLDKIPFFGFLLRVKFSVYHEWLEKNFIKRYYRMAFFSKFLYYLNRLTPLIAGWQKFEFTKFFRIHFLAAALWTAVNAVFGYFFGLIIGTSGLRWILERFELVFLALLIIFVGGEYMLKRLFSRRIKKQLSAK